MKKLSSVTIFFPAYDDAKTIAYLVIRAYQAARLSFRTFKIVIIDDGSTDETQEIVHILASKFKELKIIVHKKNGGYGRAIQSGVRYARSDFVFYTDGDGQYDPMELVLLAKKMKRGVDVVNGYKKNRSDSLHRTYLGAWYNNILHRLYHLPIRDVDCDFRLMRRSYLHKISLHSTSGLVCLELVVKLSRAGAKFVEVGVHHYPRLFGSSKFFVPRKIFETLWEHVQFYRSQKSGMIYL